MSIEMSIARTAITLNEMKLQQAVHFSMLKKTMELQEMQMETLIGKLPEVAAPAGSFIDTKA